MASRYLLFSKDLIILADTVPSSAPRIPDRRFLFSSPIHFLSLGLGSGLSPKAPGTAGSLAAVPLYVLLYWVLPAQLIFMLCIPLFVLGIWLCQRTTQALGVDDHPAIVWDEMVETHVFGMSSLGHFVNKWDIALSKTNGLDWTVLVFSRLVANPTMTGEAAVLLLLLLKVLVTIFPSYVRTK